METAALLSQPLPKACVVAAAVAAAAALISRDERRRSLWMAAALVLSAGLLIGHIHDTSQFQSVSGSALKLAAVIVFGGSAIAGLAWLFVRYPTAFPVAVVATLPFRVPIAAAGTTANLLVPLYVVIAAGCGAHLWRTFRGLRSEQVSGRSAGRLEVVLAVFVVVYALQSLYSRDFDTALEQIVFFLVPFTVLFRQLLEVRWSRSVIVACLGVLVAEALVFSAIGFWEYQRRELFWNPKVIASNQFDSFFRVNSVFWDPNIYGRFLVLVMVGLTALMLWSGRAKVAAWTAVALAVLWGGLVLTFSQSSFAALLAGLVVLAALRWDVRKTVMAAGAGLAAALVVVVAFQGALGIELGSSSGFDKFSSGRGSLISGGVSLLGDRPIWGYGSGSFGRAYRQEQNGNQQESVSASHTLPITVAAEQGIIGLAVYVALLAFALQALLGNGRYRTAVSERGPPPDQATFVPARAAVAAAFVALIVHTFSYAAFLEDPVSWVLLAAGLAFAPCAALATRPAPVRARPALGDSAA